MACFSAPAAAAAVTTIFRKKIPKEYHIEWFNMLVLGGSAGLFLEHMASGEITPYPPFLTAMESQAAFNTMIAEIISIGIPMLAACTLVWAGMVYTANKLKQTAKAKTIQ